RARRGGRDRHRKRRRRSLLRRGDGACDPRPAPRCRRDPRLGLHALRDDRGAAGAGRGPADRSRPRGRDGEWRGRDRPGGAGRRRRSRRRLPPARPPMTDTQTIDTPGAALRDLRERRPLVHQITNYVVMNETANATLALGALPVMAHAPEEVEELAAIAGALVLNIGTLSRHWIDAMLLAGKAANAANVPVVLDPVGVGATSLRTETAKRILGEVDVAILRGNPAEVAALIGIDAEIRGVEAIGVETGNATIARTAAQQLGVAAAVTGPIDHVSDGSQTMAVANGDPLLATITGSGCM